MYRARRCTCMWRCFMYSPPPMFWLTRIVIRINCVVLALFVSSMFRFCSAFKWYIYESVYNDLLWSRISLPMFSIHCQWFVKWLRSLIFYFHPIISNNMIMIRSVKYVSSDLFIVVRDPVIKLTWRWGHSDQEGCASRARLHHCTPVKLTPALIQIGWVGREIYGSGDSVRASLLFEIKEAPSSM